MSSGSLPSSKEFKNSHQQQSLNPIIALSTQSNPPTHPDPENPLVVDDEDFKGAADQDHFLNPERSTSFASVEVSVGPSVSFVSDGMMTSPTTSSRRTQKRKKGKGFGNYKKKQAFEKKLQTLAERLNLVPFIPKVLDLTKHEVLFKSLGLWDFVSIVMGSDFNDIRSDLVSQLIATYDPKSRGSYVNDFRIKVNRADLARAFKLPLRKEKTGATDSGDMDLSVVSSEGSMAFLMDFVTSWVILNNDEEVWIMPDMVAKMIKPIEEGHPEQMDWSTLLWSMVEKELAQGEQLEHCNYAPHLQHLIRSQREDLLSMEPEEGVTSQETKTVLQKVLKEDDGDEEEVREVKGQDKVEKALTKDDVGDEEEVSEINGMDKEEKVTEKKDDGVEEMVLEVKGQASVEKVLEKNDGDELLEKIQDKEEAVVEAEHVKETVVETEIGVKDVVVKTEMGVKEEILVTQDGDKEQVLKMNELDGEEVLLEKKDNGEEELLVKLEKNDYGDEVKLEKNDEEEVLEKYRHNNVEVLELKDDVEEETLEKEKKDDSKEEEELEGNVGPRVDLTLGQELITEVVSKDAEMVDLGVINFDHVVQDERHLGGHFLNGKSNLGGHFLQRCSTRGNMVSSDCIEENDVIEEEERMGAEHDLDVLPTDIDEFEGEGLDVNFLGTKLSYGAHGSLGHNSSVDIMDSQDDMHESGPSFYQNNGKRKVHDDVHISRHGNDNKRFRTEQDLSYRQPEDFGMIMEQMQFFMDKAKTKYMEKEQEQEQSKLNQQLLFDELQKRDAVIENLQQLKQEEIEKRDLQIYRLNRELLLMCSLLEEYKKSLKKTDKAFKEYRLKNQQIPEEPMYKDAGNGLVLSIADFEKQQQIEEEKLKSEIEHKAKEAEEGYTLQFEEFMDKVDALDKKLSVIENGFKSLKESFSRSKLSETSVPSLDD